MAVEHTPGSAPKVGTELQTWRTRVLNILLGTMSAVATVSVISSTAQAIQDPALWPQTVPFLLTYAFLLVLTLWRRLDSRIRAWGLLIVGYAVGALYLAILGLLGNGTIFLLALPALGVTLLGYRSGLALAGFSLLVYAAFTILASLGWMADWLVIQENSLALSQWLSQGLSFGLVLVALVVIQSLFSQAQTQALERARQATDELGLARDQLQAHSEEIDRYAWLLEVGALVSRETALLLDRDELLERIVHLSAQQLGFDQVAVYLADKNGEEITLAAAARPSHELTALDLVKQVIRSGDRQSAQFPGDGRVHHELTLPLQTADQIIGALDVHATRPVPFGEQEISALQGIADLLALALENARLFAETQASLRELDALYRHYTVEAWQRFEREHAGLTHRWQSAEGLSGEVWQTLSAQARASGNIATGFDEQARLHLLAAPVKLREAPIGVIGFQRPAEAGPWEQEQIAAIEAIAGRLAPAAENLRLLDEAQRRAAHERRTAEITARVRASMDVDAILRTALQELGRTLGASEGMIWLEAHDGMDSSVAEPEGQEGGL